jgi:protocatechuate 3,4-dioxygenase beta subunit/uncharacterized protein YegP (UPF0339 family)
MRIKQLLLILLALAIALPSLALALDPQQPYLPYYWVKGTATKDGAPAANQIVSFYHKDYSDKKVTAETDAKGYFEINVYELNYYHNIAIDFGAANYVLEATTTDNYSTKESIALTVDAGFTAKDLVLIKTEPTPPAPTPTVKSIIVSPASVTLAPSGQQTFTAIGYDAEGKEVSNLSFAWSVVDAKAGSIDPATGIFTASEKAGTYSQVIKATSGAISGYATVKVEEKPAPTPKADTGAVSGTVLGTDGKALSDNTTTTLWVNGTPYVATTDATGKITVADLPPGKDYIITVGYDSATGSKYGVDIASGETTLAGDIPTYTGGTLTGTLKDPDGNLLINQDNITIVVDGIIKEGVKTNSQGQFAVDGIGADKNKIITISTGTFSTTINPYVSDYGAGKIYPLGVITLNQSPPKKGNVTGEVVAADTGTPLSGTVAYLTNNANLVYLQKTGSNGIFYLLDVTEGTYTLVLIAQDNYLSLTKAGVVVAANQTTAVGKLALTPLEKGKGAILGLVQNQDKQALSGAKVDLLAGEKLINSLAATGSDGLFSFENIDPGIYTIKATKSGFKEETQVTTVEAGKTAGPSLMLTASALKITTASLPDGQVSKTYLATLEASDGTAPYTWEVESGALPKGLNLNKATGKIDGTPAAATTETFTIKVKDAAGFSATKILKITIGTAPGTGTVTGKITDTNGKPVEGATVALGSSVATTDAEGKYIFENVPAGNYTLFVSAGGYESYSLPVTAVAGETTPVDIIKLTALSKDKAEIHGYVKDAAGQPLDGACVSAGNASTFTGSCGWYQLVLAAGNHTVTASMEGYISDSKSTHVSKGESKMMEDFKLISKDSAKTGTIIGTISDLKSKKGISGATVTDGTRSVAADLDGNYSISDVPEGSYTLKADAAGYVTGKKEEVPVTPGQTTTANIALSLVPSNKAVIHGYVRDDSGKKLDLVKVEAKGTTAYSLDGWYSLTIDPGTYTLKASLSGYKETTHEVAVAAGESKQADLTLEKITVLEPKPTIKIWFSQRLYQKALVEKGQKFVTSSKPEINIEVSINDPYTLPNDVSGYSITLDPDTPNSKTYNLSAQNITKKVYAAGYQPAAFKAMAVSSEETKEAEKIQSYSLQYTITDEISDGSHVLSFTARSSGLAGIASVQTESASIEVMGGPLRMFGAPLTYPSPFSISKQNTVTIQYNLSANAKIDIYITGVSGMRIKKFSIDAGSEGGTAGLNKVTWDGRTDQGFLAGNAIYVGTIINRDDGKLLGKFKLTIVD